MPLPLQPTERRPFDLFSSSSCVTVAFPSLCIFSVPGLTCSACLPACLPECTRSTTVIFVRKCQEDSGRGAGDVCGYSHHTKNDQLTAINYSAWTSILTRMSLGKTTTRNYSSRNRDTHPAEMLASAAAPAFHFVHRCRHSQSSPQPIQIKSPTTD